MLGGVLGCVFRRWLEKRERGAVLDWLSICQCMNACMHGLVFLNSHRRLDFGDVCGRDGGVRCS